MNREERRAEQKLRNRRLKWLSKEATKDEKLGKIITELEENFEDSEIENAKAFITDLITESGYFSEKYDADTIEKKCKHYGLETADGLFIMDVIEEAFPVSEEESTEPES